jgi:hypothetical protein
MLSVGSVIELVFFFIILTDEHIQGSNLYRQVAIESVLGNLGNNFRTRFISARAHHIRGFNPLFYDHTITSCSFTIHW